MLRRGNGNRDVVVTGRNVFNRWAGDRKRLRSGHRPHLRINGIASFAAGVMSRNRLIRPDGHALEPMEYNPLYGLKSLDWRFQSIRNSLALKAALVCNVEVQGQSVC